MGEVKMKWYELSIHTSNEATEAVSNVLHGFTTGGLMIEDPKDILKERNTLFGEVYDLDREDYPEDGVLIKTYLPDDPRLDNTFSDIQNAIQHLTTYQLDIGTGKVTVTEVEEEDWATSWKKFYKPVKISDKIMIKPTWEPDELVSDDTLIIELDPGMAFGTGTHPTTMLCVQALEQYVKANDTVIDVGCGSGVLSIAAGLLGAEKVYAYDLDDVAVSSTEKNASLNKLDKVIHATQNNLLEGMKETVQIIVSNILAEIIITFVNDAWNRLSEGGYFITSGIISEKRELVETALQESGFTVVKTNEQNGWVVIVAQKVSM